MGEPVTEDDEKYIHEIEGAQQATSRTRRPDEDNLDAVRPRAGDDNEDEDE